MQTNTAHFKKKWVRTYGTPFIDSELERELSQHFGLVIDRRNVCSNNHNHEIIVTQEKHNLLSLYDCNQKDLESALQAFTAPDAIDTDNEYKLNDMNVRKLKKFTLKSNQSYIAIYKRKRSYIMTHELGKDSTITRLITNLKTLLLFN